MGRCKSRGTERSRSRRNKPDALQDGNSNDRSDLSISKSYLGSADEKICLGAQQRSIAAVSNS
jgi:hypothetical protein